MRKLLLVVLALVFLLPVVVAGQEFVSGPPTYNLRAVNDMGSVGTDTATDKYLTALFWNDQNGGGGTCSYTVGKAPQWVTPGSVCKVVFVKVDERGRWKTRVSLSIVSTTAENLAEVKVPDPVRFEKVIVGRNRPYVDEGNRIALVYEGKKRSLSFFPPK